MTWRDCGKGHWIEGLECEVCDTATNAKHNNFRRWAELADKLKGKESAFAPPRPKKKKRKHA